MSGMYAATATRDRREAPDQPATEPTWPAPMRAPAYHSIIGDIVRAIEPETEADPAAILIQILVMFGNVIGRTPYFRVGPDVHHLNLFAAVVGSTGKSRKGVSRGQAQSIFEPLDPDWVNACITSGLSSGEGLISVIRDKSEKQRPIVEKGRVVDYETVIDDPGVTDKRLVVIQTEFSSVLKVMTREGNTLSEIIRDAWDGRDLRSITKSSPVRATAPHISIIGHITASELRRYLDATEAGNGFGNRFLWVCVQRSKELPEGGRPLTWTTELRHLARAVDHGRRCGELRRDEAARRWWHAVYGPLSAGRPGMLGAMTARAEAQVMRLACLYAVADISSFVTVDHLRAALEVWRYCFASARSLFGDRLGHPVADEILAALRRSWPESLTRTEISDLFKRNRPASEITQALTVLKDYRLAECDTDRTKEGRPLERWAYTKNELNEINEIGPDEVGATSSNSSISSAEEGARDGDPRV